MVDMPGNKSTRSVKEGVIVFHLKKRWYDEVESGKKLVECREDKEYWRRRILNNPPEIAHFYCGYPPKATKPLVKKIQGIVYARYIEIRLEGYDHQTCKTCDEYLSCDECIYYGRVCNRNSKHRCVVFIQRRGK